MNRDESLLRPLARPPVVTNRGSRLALFPSEATGGSWVGANDAGLCVALINWYAVARAPGSGRVSRGIIVPAVLAAANLPQAKEIITALPKQDMSPFRLLVFAPHERIAREFRWNQRALEELPHAWEPRHWFSSGCDEPHAQRERGRVAREAWRESPAGRLPWLRRLHASHEPARGPFCFCMHRKDAATVSYTEVVVTRRTATMRYHDGPLCSAPRPVTTQQITLQAVCKESAPRPTNQETTQHHECHPLPV
ncbi:MAG: NRDE family protein [Chthoniobacter sp.]|uniref:NRDE family protein n=1 Tax=Chthoniobacter sp. TaxID=2510640 RepID=UPI0032AD43CB